MIYLCAYGCGQCSEENMIHNKEALKDGDRSYYCPGCKRDAWYLIPDDGKKESRIICREGVCIYGEPVEYCERYSCKCYNFEKAQEGMKDDNNR